MGRESTGSGAGRRVLVVEDEAHQRTVLRRALEGKGYAVTTVESAEQALETLEDDPPLVAILDLNLPQRSGLELASILRERLPATQLIILTGYGDLASAREAIRLDVVDFLLKPCPLDEFERAIDRAHQRGLEHAARRMGDPGPRTIDEVERELVSQALARHDGNRTKAAAELGISVRTLYYRLSRYEAEDRRSVGPPWSAPR